MSEDPAEARAARTMSTLAMLALMGATLAVLGAAAPAILRASMPGGEGDRRALMARGASHSPRRTGLPPSHPRLDPLDDDDDASDGDPSTGNIDTPPGEPRVGHIFAPSDGEERPRPGGDREPRDRPESVRLGLARQAVKLREGPRDGGAVLGEISAGEQVVVLRESGEWSLIVHGGRMGWTKKSEIAVR